MRRRDFLVAMLSAPGGLAASGLAGVQGTGSMLQAGYPAPRYPAVPIVTSVNQLLPNVRHIIRRKRMNSRPGYAIQGGERVVFVADAYSDPWVIEAFGLAFREAGCSLDQIILDAPRRVWDSAEVLELSVRTSAENRVRLWNMRLPYLLELFQGYDVITAPDYLPASHVMQGAYGRRHLPMVWPTRELLADSSLIRYPEAILNLVERKAWAIIRGAERVHITDPEGTDLTFTYREDYWSVLEGTHPTYKIRGGWPGKANEPFVEGHLMAVPRFQLPGSDAEGIVAGTVESWPSTVI